MDKLLGNYLLENCRDINKQITDTLIGNFQELIIKLCEERVELKNKIEELEEALRECKCKRGKLEDTFKSMGDAVKTVENVIANIKDK